MQVYLSLRRNRDDLAHAADAKKIIEEQMVKNDKMTGVELQKLLAKSDIQTASLTALRWQTQLGWTSKGTSYCQMIREANEEKRLERAEKNICPLKKSYTPTRPLYSWKCINGLIATKKRTEAKIQAQAQTIIICTVCLTAGTVV